jgi:protein-disulfide isomerase
MRHFIRIFGLGAVVVFMAMPVHADVMPFPEQAVGKADAPIKVDEYVSLTCSHCAEFYNDTLPELEKRYVATGKVRFVMHDFVLDGMGLKAAQLAHCMPGDEFFPFIKTLYKNQTDWVLNADPERILISYAKLGGLSEDQAKACLKDTKLQDAIVTERDSATEKYKIEATPTFIINDGAETIKGDAPVDQFAKIFDQMLAKKH